MPFRRGSKREKPVKKAEKCVRSMPQDGIPCNGWHYALITDCISGILNCAVLDGEVAVPCNLQSAIAGLNSYRRSSHVRLPYGGGVEERVLCNANP